MNYEDKVYEFHKAFGHPTAEFPNLPQDTDIRELRMALLDEEFNEYLLAESNNDLAGIADALGDMLYIIFGTAITYGIPIGNVFGEIHRSNMTKLGLDGKPVLADNGKVMKGPLYEKPDIRKVIAVARFRKLASVDVANAGLRIVYLGPENIKNVSCCGVFKTGHEPNSVVFAKTYAKSVDLQPGPQTTTFNIEF